jgi:hypothetical protein
LDRVTPTNRIAFGGGKTDRINSSASSCSFALVSIGASIDRLREDIWKSAHLIFTVTPDPANALFAMDNVISTAHCLCWTDSFVDAVARDAITGILNVIQGRLPDFVVNFEATTYPRVRAWSSAV